MLVNLVVTKLICNHLLLTPWIASNRSKIILYGRPEKKYFVRVAANEDTCNCGTPILTMMYYIGTSTCT